MTRDVATALVIYLKGALTALDMSTKLTFMDLPDILWGLKVYIGDGIKRTSNPGQAIDVTTDISDIWNDNVTVFYKEDSPSISAMSLVYTFRSRPMTTKVWREDARQTEVIETSNEVQEKLVAPVAGYILGDTL